ncbi:MAG: UDP-N-acetylglucosamine 2-epimerase (non-hydrolyzing) [Rhodothermia bacterium]|nr:MAG: UDP-N-acetylglucosamine 2-epimerase (non-hydrolyzing) [Rhodothermia bacterium]
MIEIISVVGARPQFIKAAMVSRALKEAGIGERLIHTGQHYDDNMSSIFFDELDIPAPDINLEVGSGSHARQTGEIMVRLEEHLLQNDRPDCVLVYGDTNTTAAAAVTARKLLIPVAHVEAGLRSFNMHMPEEINRIVTDRLSDFLFCPTQTACDHLKAEGLTDGISLTGDVMYDAVVHFSSTREPAGGRFPEGTYALATVHRAENTDDPDRLAGIIRGLGNVGIPVIFPVHPRTAVRLQGFGLPDNISVMEPLSYVQMLHAIKGAHRVFTDSGGIQKEAIWLETPCITLRDETEWVETLDRSWNVLVGADPAQIKSAMDVEPVAPPPVLCHIGEDSASSRIASILASA